MIYCNIYFAHMIYSKKYVTIWHIKTSHKREYVNGQTYNPNCIHQILLIGRFQGISRPHFCATRLSTSSHCLLNIFASDQLSVNSRYLMYYHFVHQVTRFRTWSRGKNCVNLFWHQFMRFQRLKSRIKMSEKIHTVFTATFNLKTRYLIYNHFVHQITCLQIWKRIIWCTKNTHTK